LNGDSALRNFWIIFALASLLIPSVSAGDITTIDKTNTVGMGVNLGFYSLYGGWVKEAFRGGVGIGGQMSYNFTGTVGVVSTLYYQWTRQTPFLKHSFGGGTMHILSLSVGPRFTFRVASEMNPLLDILFGYNQINIKGGIGEHSETLYSLGARFGVEFFMAKKFSITPSMGFIYMLKDFDTDGLYLPPQDNRRAEMIPFSVELQFYI
jgi:hypothetical protein